MEYKIRPIEQKDNAQIAAVIRNIFIELDAPKVGTAYADPHLDTLFDVYNNENEAYFVVEVNNEVVGGCGIGQLIDDVVKVCELQKMYLAPTYRGKGIAEALMEKCLETAKNKSYHQCYIETLPFMKAAQKLYVKSGFKYIDGPIGSTGHNACDVFMIKDLN
jgi:putative acetyltransferase